MIVTVTLEVIRDKTIVPTRIQQRLKRKFRAFFEGWETNDEAVVQIPVERLGVTNIEMIKSKGNIELEVTLERPGLLIGKGGSTIDALQKYLSEVDNPVVIKIVESKLWR